MDNELCGLELKRSRPDFLCQLFSIPKMSRFSEFIGVSFLLPWSTQAGLTTPLTSLVSTANRRHSVSESAKQVAIQSTSEWKPALAHTRHTLIRWITRLTSGNSVNAASHQLKDGKCLILPNCTSGISPLVQLESAVNCKCSACTWRTKTNGQSERHLLSSRW